VGDATVAVVEEDEAVKEAAATAVVEEEEVVVAAGVEAEEEAVVHLPGAQITVSSSVVIFKIVLFIDSSINNCFVFIGLPPTGSWQDLKDHMREAGDVCYADTYKDGTGMVEFLRYEDMKYAIKKLDDSRFRSHEVYS